MIINPDKLIPGDIILTNQKGFVSVLIRYFTFGKFSHAMLYLGRSSYIEAIGLGVHARNLLRFNFKSQARCRVYRLKDEHQYSVSDAICYARSWHGSAYSVCDAMKAGLINIFESVLPFRFSMTKQFCSRLVTEAYHTAGVNLCNKHFTRVRPVDLQKSDKLICIEDCYLDIDSDFTDKIKKPSYIDIQDKATVEMMRGIWKILKKFKIEIGGVSEITKGLLQVPLSKRNDIDRKISEIIKKSGYLELWKVEMELCPQNHDIIKFIQYVRGEDPLVGIRKAKMLYESALEQQKRHNNNLMMLQSVKNVELYETITLQITLEQNLIDNATNRVKQFAHFTNFPG